MVVAMRGVWFVVMVGCGGGRAVPTDATDGAAIDAPIDAPIDATDAPPDACVPTGAKVIFLNRGGGTYTPGADDDSSMNVSQILQGFGIPSVTVPPPIVEEATWGSFVDCVRSKFAAFNVVITDADPGAGPHTELLVLERSEDFGIGGDRDCLGVFQCDGAVGMFQPRAIPLLVWNGVTQPADRCWLAARVIANSFGVDHRLECGNLMSFVAGDCGPTADKTFEAPAGSCGEFAPRPCFCPTMPPPATKLLLELGPAACP